MKLASLKNGTRDGRLVVVSKDLTRYTDASFLVPNLQAALDDWRRIAPHLEARMAAMAAALSYGHPVSPQKSPDRLRGAQADRTIVGRTGIGKRKHQVAFGT